MVDEGVLLGAAQQGARYKGTVNVMLVKPDTQVRTHTLREGGGGAWALRTE